MTNEFCISIVIPVLNEEKILSKMTDHLNALKQNAEIIFVDGGSSDKTVELAGQFGNVLRAKKGRATQMNLGAREARGDILLFLHADCFLNENALSSIRGCIQRGNLGGCFTQRLTRELPIYRKIERVGNMRAKKSGIFFGDQGIFVRRDVFHRLGGFPEVPVMEDVLFSQRLKTAGKTECLNEPIYVSTRRWDKQGFVRTNIIYEVMWRLHGLNVPLSLINRLYRNTR